MMELFEGGVEGFLERLMVVDDHLVDLGEGLGYSLVL